MSKILPLESLRGIAAISVALYHFKVESFFNNSFTQNAWLMVDFFFVLSGFVIAYNYFDKIFTFQDIVKFQKKRFLRLYPLHFIMLAIFLFIEVAKYFVEVKFGLKANNEAFTNNNLQTFLANIFLIQNYFTSKLTFNTPSWSISAEFYTYFLFALIFFCFRGKKKFIIFILFLKIICFGYFLHLYGMSTANGPFRCLYAFSLGVLMFILYEKLKTNNFTLNSSTVPVSIIIVTIFIIIKVDPNNDKYTELIILLFGGTVLCLVLTKNSSKINLFLSQKYLVYLGTISYGIYMIHAAVWWVINQFFRFVVKVDTKINQMGDVVIVFENVMHSSFVSFAGLIIIIFLSHLSYKFVESKLYT